MSNSLRAPKPMRIHSPRTLQEYQDGEYKGELEWGTLPTEDPSMEVKRIWVSEEILEVVPIRRSTPKLKDCFAEPFSPTRNPSPPIRSQNPFEAAETAEMDAHCYEPSHEVDLILTESSPIYDDPRSPASGVDEDDHDPVVDAEFDQDETYDHREDEYGSDGGGDEEYYEAVPPPRTAPFSRSYSPEEEPTDAYMSLPPGTPAFDPFQGTEEVAYGTHLVLQIATAPVTPCYKRKRGENISRSLPDIRFPDYLRQHSTVHAHCPSYYDEEDYSSYPYSYEPPPPPPPPCFVSPKRPATSSPFFNKSLSSISHDLPIHTSPAISLLTSALLNHRTQKHRRCQSSQLTLTGLTKLMENVNEIEASGGVISPSQRYRHTVS